MNTHWLFWMYLVVVAAIVTVSGGRYLAKSRYLCGIVATMGVLVSIGQSFRDDRLTYPFSHWGMYATRYPLLYHSEYIIWDDTGEEYHYPVEHIAVGSFWAFMRKLDDVAMVAHATNDWSHFEQLALSLAKIHKDRTGRTVVSFRAYDAKCASMLSGPQKRWLRYEWTADTPGHAKP